jgi:MFS family permease
MLVTMTNRARGLDTNQESHLESEPGRMGADVATGHHGVVARHRAVFAFTLAVSMGIGPFATNSINALAPIVVPEFGLTRTELGSLTTIVFGVAGLTSILAGRQVDHFGGRPTLIVGFGCGAVAAGAMALSQGLSGFWVGAAFAGSAVALANPVTNQLIADHVPAGRRGLLLGLKQSGVPMVQGFVGLAVPAVALLVGWRGAVSLGIIAAIVGAAMGMALIPRAPRVRSIPKGIARAPLDRSVRWLAAYSFVIGIGVQPVLVYVPLYAFERVGLATATAGMSLGVIGVFGVAGRIGWAQASERRVRASVALAMVSTIATAATILILLGEYVGSWTLWVGVAGFGLSALAANSVVMMAVLQGSHDGSTGRATGIVSSGIFLGFMLGPATFGALTDVTDSYTVAWGLVAGLFFLSLLLALLWRRADKRFATAP